MNKHSGFNSPALFAHLPLPDSYKSLKDDSAIYTCFKLNKKETDYISKFMDIENKKCI